MTPSFLNLRAGDWVEVRSREEILASLDTHGALEALPFMPEMLESCGRRFRVYKRAHKTCDTIHKTGGRRMERAVHLEGVRCGGTSHGDCQARCLIFWKEAWLRRIEPLPVWRRLRLRRRQPADQPSACSEAEMRAAAELGPDPADGQMRYACQATRLFEATQPLAWWDVRQYAEDISSGNARPRAILEGLAFRTFSNLLHVGGYRLLLRLYAWFQRLRGGRPYPQIQGRLERTPSVDLGIRPGALVRVRTREQIEATLDRSNKNRGLLFDPEMTLFCGGVYRVGEAVERILDERTGKLIRLKDSLTLEGVHCQACYSVRRIGCPRAIPPYWRQQWLEPVETEAAAEGSRPPD